MEGDENTHGPRAAERCVATAASGDAWGSGSVQAGVQAQLTVADCCRPVLFSKQQKIRETTAVGSAAEKEPAVKIERDANRRRLNIVSLIAIL